MSNFPKIKLPKMWGPSWFSPPRTSRITTTLWQRDTGGPKGDLGGRPRDTTLAGLPTTSAVNPPKQVFYLIIKLHTKGKILKEVKKNTYK